MLHDRQDTILVATPDTIAKLYNTTPDHVTRELDSDPLVTRRQWLSCANEACRLPTAAEITHEDVTLARYHECPACHQHSLDPTHTTTTYALQGSSPPSNPLEALPSPDLDLALALALNMSPCHGWDETNFGSAGGPALIGSRCDHARGACWPTSSTSSMHGTIGGLPRFSTDRRTLSLQDLPPYSTLQLQPGPSWTITLPSRSVTGLTEPHALTLALLASLHDKTSTPKWDDQNKWNPRWKTTALSLGLNPTTLPPPWTPPLVLAAGRVLQSEERTAYLLHSETLEQTRPRKHRMLFSSNLAGDDTRLDQETLRTAHIHLGNLHAEATLRGQARAQEMFDQRTASLLNNP